MTVFYTGAYDTRVDRSHLWPTNTTFLFYDNAGLERSMSALARILEPRLPGIWEAFDALVPWAFKADIWRYAVLFVCGGVYVDAKLELATPFDQLLNMMGFHRNGLNDTGYPQLYSCVDEAASKAIRKRELKHVKCVYQAFIAAERHHPALLRTLRHVIKNVKQRLYPARDVSSYQSLFITGPCAMGVATQHNNPNWNMSVNLNTRLGYKIVRWHPWTAIRYIVGSWVPRGRNADDELQVAAFRTSTTAHEKSRTNYYVDLFDEHKIYKDDLAA